MKIRYLTSLILIAVNLYPLYGMLFLGLQFRDLLVIYLVETIIVLFFTFLKLYFLKINLKKIKQDPPLFFFVGIFFNLISLMVVTSNMYFNSINEAFSNTTKTALFGLFLSHGFSFFKNFFGNKEYLKLTPYRVVSPYILRTIATYIIMFGANFYIWLILLKTFAELIVHNNEHNQDRSIK